MGTRPGVTRSGAFHTPAPDRFVFTSARRATAPSYSAPTWNRPTGRYHSDGGGTSWHFNIFADDRPVWHPAYRRYIVINSTQHPEPNYWDADELWDTIDDIRAQHAGQALQGPVTFETYADPAPVTVQAGLPWWGWAVIIAILLAFGAVSYRVSRFNRYY